MLIQSQGDNGVSDRLSEVYASRLLNEAKRNYVITDFKGLAVSWAITCFKKISRNAIYYNHKLLCTEGT